MIITLTLITMTTNTDKITKLVKYVVIPWMQVY